MIRLEATYPASDGSAPESVSVEWGDGDKVSAGELATLIAALARVPRRYDTPTQPSTTP